MELIKIFESAHQLHLCWFIYMKWMTYVKFVFVILTFYCMTVWVESIIYVYGHQDSVTYMMIARRWVVSLNCLALDFHVYIVVALLYHLNLFSLFLYVHLSLLYAWKERWVGNMGLKSWIESFSSKFFVDWSRNK